MGTRRASSAALEERAARAERERDAQAQIAAAAERARIARELHDVTAWTGCANGRRCTAERSWPDRAPAPVSK
jgi:hypothetical protein